MELNHLAQLIEQHRDNGVDFGDPNAVPPPSLIPTPARVSETEEHIGVPLPPSYLWFVNSYGGGEVWGEEIFSIYSEFRPEAVGDIGLRTIKDRDEGWISDTEIVISTNDFGEIFTMDSSQPSDEGEYPVYVRRGQHREAYADTFADFLVRRIVEVEV